MQLWHGDVEPEVVAAIIFKLEPMAFPHPRKHRRATWPDLTEGASAASDEVNTGVRSLACGWMVWVRDNAVGAAALG